MTDPVGDYCPHKGHCSEALGCHAGTVHPDVLRYSIVRDGRVYAQTWAGPRGPTHWAADGEEPRVEPTPKWVK